MASINISSFAGAGAQFFDNNGTPLVGGLLYVYTAGTTTPVTTYTNPSGTVNNTNPIVLDSGGRTPEQIFVNGGVLYKFILKNSANVTIGTYDNIPAIDDPTTFNNLITVTGTNTLLGTSTPPNNVYAAGMTLSFVVANTNTGPVTIDVDGLGAKEITVQTTPLIAGQLNAGGIAAIEYDGTRFQLMNVSGATTFTTVTATNLRVTNITDTAGGNTAQINGMTPTAQSLQGFRNRIINGNMRIDQRNGGAAVTITSDTFVVDRFKAFRVGGAATITGQRSTVAPTGFTNSVIFTVGTGAAPGAGDYTQFDQNIEGFNTADLGWGTASAQSVTVSFWVRSSLTGTFGFAFRNDAGNRSYVASYTISAANTWEYKTVTVLGDTTGTWLTNNSSGIKMTFDLGVGSTFSTTAGSWQAGNFIGLTGGTKLAATAGATFYITGVQLEAGSVATPFERRDYGRELIMCQRYYEKSYSLDTVPGTATATGMVIYPSTDQATTQFVGGTQTYRVEKRAAATISAWDVAGNSARTSLYTTGGLGRTDNNNNINTLVSSTSGFYAIISCAGANFPALQWVASIEL
jgi:hypothetical protein